MERFRRGRSSSGAGPASADGLWKQSWDLERGHEEAGSGERLSLRTRTGARRHVSLILTWQAGREQSPDVWSSWNPSPLLLWLWEDVMVSCYDWESVTPGIPQHLNIQFPCELTNNPQKMLSPDIFGHKTQILVTSADTMV